MTFKWSNLSCRLEGKIFFCSKLSKWGESEGFDPALKIRIQLLSIPFYLRTMEIFTPDHTWASSKSPGEGVQLFFQQGGLIFQNRGGPLQKFFSRIS